MKYVEYLAKTKLQLIEIIREKDREIRTWEKEYSKVTKK